MKIRAIAAGFALLALGACAPNLCVRKDRYFANQCFGKGVSYRSDPYCETRLDRCSPQEKAAIEAYVSCLEGQQCSFQTSAACAQQFPAGASPMCLPKTPG